MAWRIVTIENPAYLSIKNQQLQIKQEEIMSLPIEDINALVIDSYGVTLSTQLLSELAQSKVLVVICNQNHLPNAIILPYEIHSRHAKITDAQLSLTKPMKKRLWQRIICQKITNQALVLEYFNLPHSVDLFKLATQIKSGDTDNRESIAARLYFDDLLDGATRQSPIWYNSALNYTYTLVRTMIARQLAASGLATSQGLFHRNQLNSFNLADDLIEPFRPLVDKFIIDTFSYKISSLDDHSLTKEERHQLLDIFNYSVIINNRKYSLKFAIEAEVESFAKAILIGNSNELSLPKI